MVYGPLPRRQTPVQRARDHGLYSSYFYHNIYSN